VWWAEYQVNNKRIRKTTHQKDKSAAQEIHDDLIRDAKKHLGVGAVFKGLSETHRGDWAELIASELQKGDGGQVGLLCRRAASRAKVNGRPCLLDYKTLGYALIECGGYCSVTGTPLSFFDAAYLKPSVDRIDNSRGYVLDNIRITCAVANLAMNKWGEPALRQMCAHYARKILLESPTNFPT
jgi:hypothetical protein